MHVPHQRMEIQNEALGAPLAQDLTKPANYFVLTWGISVTLTRMSWGVGVAVPLFPISGQ